MRDLILAGFAAAWASTAAATSSSTCEFVSPTKTKAVCEAGEFDSETVCTSAPVKVPFTSQMAVDFVAVGAFATLQADGKPGAWGFNIYTYYVADDGAHFRTVTLSGGLRLEARNADINVRKCYRQGCSYTEVVSVSLFPAGSKETKPGYATYEDFFNWLTKNPNGRMEILGLAGRGSIVTSICQPVWADFINTTNAHAAKK